MKLNILLIITILLVGVICEEQVTEASETPQKAEAKKKILFVSPPALSHVNMLREVAVGLLEEYGNEYELSFATAGKFLKLASEVPGLRPLLLSPEALGESNEQRLAPCRDMNDIPEVRGYMQIEDPLARVQMFAHLNRNLFDCQLEVLNRTFRDPATRPDLLVLDLFELPATVLAELYGIDFVILGALGIAGYEERVWLPNGLFGGSIHDMHSIWHRAENLWIIAQVVSKFSGVFDSTNQILRHHNLPEFSGDVTETWYNHLVLIPEPWMFHHARPVNPNAQLIGFLSPPPDSPRAAIFMDPAKEGPLFAWLDQAHANDWFVFYIAFGSHTHVPEDTLNTLVLGVLQSNPKATVLVGIRDDVKVDLHLSADQATRLRRESWVPQTRVLAHPAVKVFVSHGGKSSMAEAVHAHVPIIFLPFFGDQPKNAWQCQDAGVGLVLNRMALTLDQVIGAAQNMISNYPQFKANTKKMAQISEFAGGRKRAAQLIHAHLQFGSDHLITVERDFTIVERFNLDILAIFLVVVFLIFWIILRIIKFIFVSLFLSTKKSKVE